MKETSEATRSRLKEFNSQSLASLVSALATIGHATPELFHGTAKVDNAPPAFLDAITDVTPSRLKHHNSQVLVPDAAGIASTVWTFAKLGQASPELFEAIAVVIRSCLRYYNSQDLAHTVWALVYLIMEVAAGSVHAAWASATVGHASPELFDAFARCNLLSVAYQMLLVPLQKICTTILELLDPKLVSRAFSGESKVFISKIQADYYRYLLNSLQDTRSLQPQSALKYDEAAKVAENGFHVSEPQHIAWTYATDGHAWFSVLPKLYKVASILCIANTAWAFVDHCHSQPCITASWQADATPIE